MKIEHDLELVSFAHIDENRDLYTYYFEIENTKIKLHSIQVWRKNGNSGKTYKHEEIYHYQYKNSIYNYETDEFENPEIPETIKKYIENYRLGFLVSNVA